MKYLMLLLLPLLPVLGPSVAAADALESGFLNPPDSAKPQTWWHWMNGNITKTGITADLEAMKQIGLGGATVVNVDCGIPPGNAPFMGQEWQDDFKFAASEANRLGLKLGVENCAGWSSSGGPWNTVTNAMQCLASSETNVAGPVVFDAPLPQPPVILDFYRDIAVLAFRVSPVVANAVSNAPSADRLEIKSAVYETKSSGPSADVTAKIIAMIKSGQKSVVASNDELGGDPAAGQVKQLRVEFTLDGKPGTLTVDENDTLIFPVNAAQLAAARLIQKTSVNQTFVRPPPPAGSEAVEPIPLRGILNLTSKLTPGGRLKWNVPPGNWIILRLGYTPIGTHNHPAPQAGDGLECDKFSKTALDQHWNGFMQKVLDDVGPLAGTTLNASLIDSYEVGSQDWTANFRNEFEKRRGYDPVKFLPTFTRRIVDNPAVTERFLWDVRRTIADLFADDYYGHFDELCRQHGLTSDIEPYEGPYESLQCGAPAGLVMGEFWAGSDGNPSIKLAASVAHIYGKTVVGAESFTEGEGRWQDDPYSLKMLGDLMYCQGVNRYTFHRYAMQPWTNHWPGMTMGQFGINFERTETWWNQGKPWIDYLTHCQFLLQQGHAVEDAAYFDGQSAPVEMRGCNPPLPAGYDYDAVDAGVLLHGATVRNGRLTLADGANYAVLVLPPDDINMTPQLLECIRKLVREGATVIGPRPQHSPSLQDYPRCDRQVKAIAAKLWGNCDGVAVQEHPYGWGRVVWGRPLEEVFAEQHLEPDFEFTNADGDAKLAYMHRVDGGTDIYFVSNQRHRFDSDECTFRVAGKTPELWHPDTGLIETAPVWSERDGRTTVELNLDPAGSVFVVFRQTAGAADHVVSAVFSEAKPMSQPKPAELRILKAAYGAFPTGEMTWSDVTAKVKSLVAGGTVEITAGNALAQGDPAPDIPKELRVQYSLGGQSVTVAADEGDSLTLPPSATVVRALYGEFPLTNAIVDVTGKVAALVKDGRLDVAADNALAGGDPASRMPKELRVDYSLDGIVRHAIVPENETLTLPTGGNLGEPPPCEIRAGANGAPAVAAWQNGRVELRTADGKVLGAEAGDVPGPKEITGEWTLNFPPHWGAPASVTLKQLISWPDSTNDGVRYFSGTATYEREIDISADRLASGRELWLDLGEVKDFAVVSLNGRDFGVLWKPPFRVNITAAARPGANRLAVKVTNLWPNRLIGDEQLPRDVEWDGKQLKEWPQWLLDGRPSPTGRLTFTTWHHYTKDSPLLESGLLGPVTLQTEEPIPLR